MIKTILIILLLILFSCSSQQLNKTASFTYNWQIQDSIFTIKFANNHWNKYSTNNDTYGYFSTNCRETYLDFISKLTQYGKIPNYTEITSDRTDDLEIITEPSQSYMLMIDNQKRIWKLTKSDALILAKQLNTKKWINIIQLCSNIEKK